MGSMPPGSSKRVPGGWGSPPRPPGWPSVPRWPGGPFPRFPGPGSARPAGTAGSRSTSPPARRTRSLPGSCRSGRTPGCTPLEPFGITWWTDWSPLPNMPERTTTRRSTRASDRLRRLLVVVPYVVRHPGVRVEELTRLFGVGETELLDDLNLLFVSGLPPYGPGDLIDVQVEEGRVWIGMADYFARPVRLTRAEALALYLKGKALLGTPGLEEAPDLASALAKIEGGLG